MTVKQFSISKTAIATAFTFLASTSLLTQTANAETIENFTPCMVSDSGGFDDRSFNQLSYEGLQAAAKQLGVEIKQAESRTETDFGGNISGLIDAGCNIVVSVGFLLADATIEAAENNTDVNFALVDVADTGLDNVQSIVFDTTGAAFLAGYAAADTTKTGVVGTFGGMQIPAVTIFMDGFAQGVNYYNEKNNKNVKALGWNFETQNGLFTGGFAANESAKSAAVALIDQNADIIMPVGGPVFISAAEAIIDSKKEIAMIGVDSDLFISEPKYRALYLTSVLKKLDEGVKASVIAAGEGNFSNTAYIGTLANEGVDIAPFHDWESKVRPELTAELNAIKQEIIDGKIQVSSPASPIKQ